MTLLMWTQYEDAVEIVSDTLVTAADGRTPVRHELKVWALPHLNMAMATTGTAEIGWAWRDLLQQVTTEDIESVNTVAPTVIPQLRDNLTAQHGDTGTTSVYHFGFPTGSNQIVSYRYSSLGGGTDFAPERFQGSRFAVKPGPQGFTLHQMPESRDEHIALALRIRAEQDALISNGTVGVRIGGELVHTLVENGNAQSNTFYRFDDYNESLPTTMPT